ncbi:hypothetical protein GPECTOR_52g66 [Gonium pectorale]|uniref:PAS domain-containing protein n=1 Tax=Gonium pectorale TaxID=33097 RepID=A0A150G757_GONPE|nr:hypothetical protein GPECTOR_52g66 [Gonium pectorale]|eukprot:KXZ45668.1 hypothetical protein GPECTOR_52g66 [Gonium pectorale]
MSVYGGSSYAASAASSSSRSSASRRVRKENHDHRVRIRWVLVKVFIDAWQLFTTVITPDKQGWRLNGTAWAVVSVLNFGWLADLGYGAYLAVLYSMVALLAVNVAMCVWVAWCFKEHKFPVVWPIKVLRVFSSVFFQAFDVTSLNLLQLGFSCQFTGPSKPRLHFQLIPEYSCTGPPHITHAVVSGLSLVLFVAIALLLNMAEVEVNPLSRRPLALGHSGAEVAIFAVKVLLTLVDVFIGWKKVAACFYLALSLALAYQQLRWSAHMVAWMNYVKSGVSVAIVWASAMLVVLVFRPGVKEGQADDWAGAVTITMLAGLGPAFVAGALLSWFMTRRMTITTLKAIANAKPDTPLEDVCASLDDPRDVEIVARCCRVFVTHRAPDPEAANKAHNVIKAGLALFPNSAYMVLLHANFMIDVLGIHQSGSRRIEDARKLNPGLMCRFIMFVRQQQATQKAAGTSANDGTSMDLLGKALDASNISFMHLSKALGKIETSVSQAQTAYRVVLESYGNSAKLVRLYGKFLLNIKNDPWGAAEYFTEADRLEEATEGDARGPLLPDGTPLGRMDELSIAVLVVNVFGEVQVANRQSHHLFGYKRGQLEGKRMAALLAPHCSQWLSEQLNALVAQSGLMPGTFAAFTASGAGGEGVGAGGADEQHEAVVVGMHSERLAFPLKLTLRRVSGVGDDTTIVAMMEPLAAERGVATLWVAQNGTIAACDPQFIATYGWRPGEVNGVSLTMLLSVKELSGSQTTSVDAKLGAARTKRANGASDIVKRLQALAAADVQSAEGDQGMPCLVAHKYETTRVPAFVRVVSASGTGGVPMYELRVSLCADPTQLLVVNNKGAVLHVSTDLADTLKGTGGRGSCNGLPLPGSLPNGHDNGQPGGDVGQLPGDGLVLATDLLAGYTLADFLPPPWRDMHIRYLKSTTVLSPPARGQLSCRKGGLLRPILEMRTATGNPLYMRVAVTTSEMAGELTHAVRLASSSLDEALLERRLRLRLSEHGRIVGFADGTPPHLFGLEPSQLVGRGLWEVIEEPASVEGGGATSPAHGSRMFSSLVNRALAYPEYSWRVRVLPPQRPNRGVATGLMAAARANMARSAVMQVHVEVPAETADDDQAPEVFVDLWPATSVSGVLELDAGGRITTVLEERTRPAGLLFGLPSASLMGASLEELVALPPGRTKPADLLSLHGAKKSSLKVNNKGASFKVGPVHTLQGSHSDGRPLTLDVQVVGRPGANQPLTAIIRLHVVPMVPGKQPAPPPARPPPQGQPAAAAAPPPPTLLLPQQEVSPIVPAGRRGSVGPVGRSPTAALIGRRNSVGIAMPKASKVSGTTAAAAALSQMPPFPPALTEQGQLSGGAPSSTGDQNSGRAGSTPQPATPPGQPAPSPADGFLAMRRGSDAVECFISEDASAAVKTPTLTPQDLLSSGVGEGLPTPGVTVSRASLLAGRSKLADLVKVAGGSGRLGRGNSPPLTSPVDAADAGNSPLGRRLGSSSLAAVSPEGQGQQALAQQLAKGFAQGPERLALEAPVRFDANEATLPGATPRTGNGYSAAVPGAPREMALRLKGAYYQNSIAHAGKGMDEQSDQSGEDVLVQRGYSQLASAIRGSSTVQPEMVVPEIRRPPSAAALAPHQQQQGPQEDGLAGGPGPGPYPDDDAASEGGQSAMSGQSAGAGGGAEYKRGKRFRKLAKMMDSGQAQQVQSRFRAHALFVLGLLVMVHIVCFVLTVTSIQSQRLSMLKLGRSGQSQRYMHRILTDVRALDVISRNRTVPNLYSPANATGFLRRIKTDVEEVKVRLNEILYKHHARDSPVLEVLYYRTWRVWSGKADDGSDMFTNVTVWVLDALLYVAVDDAKTGDEEEDADGEDDGAGATLDADEDRDGLEVKVKRRATLNVADGAGGGGSGAMGTIDKVPSGRRNRNNGTGNTGGDGGGFVIGGAISTRGSTDVFSEKERKVAAEAEHGGGRTHARRLTAPAGAGAQSKRSLKYDSHETSLMMMPFVLWSALVIAMYATAVVKMKDVVQVVAVHSVSNFVAARAYRTVFFSQELAVVDDPALLPSRRSDLQSVRKALKDAYFTLQLGSDAYKAAGPEYRFYQSIWTGIDSIMQLYLSKVGALADANNTIPPGLADEDFDYIYNVGSVDLSDGLVEIEDAHYDSIVALFNRILLLHIVLFLMLWVIVAGFLFLLLYPLLKRVTKERRRIAELMSQLPLELDVERLVSRALGTGADQQQGAGGTGAPPDLGGGGGNQTDGKSR